MSTRERWIVYPLLFMALGLAIRPYLLNKTVGPLEFRCQTIECQNLRVKKINGRTYFPPSTVEIVPNPVAPRPTESSIDNDGVQPGEATDPPGETP